MNTIAKTIACAFGFAMLMAGSAAADELLCPQEGNNPMGDNVLVDGNASSSCILRHRKADNIKVLSGGSLRAFHTKIYGSVQCEEGALECIINKDGDGHPSMVYGNFQCDKHSEPCRLLDSMVWGDFQCKNGDATGQGGNDCIFRDSFVGGNVQFTDNIGKVRPIRGTVGGNLECSGNGTVVGAGGVMVGGDAKDDCEDFEAP